VKFDNSSHYQIFILLFQETERLLAEPVEGVNATPYEDNVRYFNVAIAGPSDSPYQGLNVLWKLVEAEFDCSILFQMDCSD
jgi:ubiquitin-protein ligase